MSGGKRNKKNKHKSAGGNPPAPAPINSQPKPADESAPTAVVSPSKPAAESEVDKRQNRQITRSNRVAFAALLASLASAIFTGWSGCSTAKSAAEAVAANKIAQAALDRTAGKVQAQFEFVDDPNPHDPNRIRPFMRKKDASDQIVFRIESPDDLMRWSPRVFIKNTGSEPIDAIRADVTYFFGSAYGEGVQQIVPPPLIANKVSTFEGNAFGKLAQGQIARIPLMRVLLEGV